MKTFMMRVFADLFAITLVLIFFAWCYSSLQSDSGLLSDQTLLKLAEDDVLGDHLYPETCPRFLYKKEIEYPYGKEPKGAAFFRFHPRMGYEGKCPSIEVSLSRYTGDVVSVDLLTKLANHGYDGKIR